MAAKRRFLRVRGVSRAHSPRNGITSAPLRVAARGKPRTDCRCRVAETHQPLSIEIRLLGLVEASQDGRPVSLGGVKPRALLAILALQANAPVSADRLIEGLWGERPPATAHKAVQVLVSQLRKHLEVVNAEIVTRGRGYELRVDPEAVDVLRFERPEVGRERRART